MIRVSLMYRAASVRSNGSDQVGKAAMTSEKAAQTALNELDCPHPLEEIKGRFMENARVALGQLPAQCFDSVERVATALAASNHNGEIPTGYGATCVRHFAKRSGQLERALNGSVESRFGLIEAASAASIAGRWGLSVRVTPASYKECLGDVAELGGASTYEATRWRSTVKYLLDRPRPAIAILRQVACTLVWCGYFAPAEHERRVSSALSDAWIARRFFRMDRAPFVRYRTDALHWLPHIRDMVVQRTEEGT